MLISPRISVINSHLPPNIDPVFTTFHHEFHQELLQDILHPQRHGVSVVSRRIAREVLAAQGVGEVLQFLREVTHLWHHLAHGAKKRVLNMGYITLYMLFSLQ